VAMENTGNKTSEIGLLINASFLTASKDEYFLFLKLTMSDMAQFRKSSFHLQGCRYQK